MVMIDFFGTSEMNLSKRALLKTVACCFFSLSFPLDHFYESEQERGPRSASCEVQSGAAVANQSCGGLDASIDELIRQCNIPRRGAGAAGDEAVQTTRLQLESAAAAAARMMRRWELPACGRQRFP